jgi:hypothetical protein
MKALIEMNAPKFVDTMFATAIIGSAHCPLHTAASALAIRGCGRAAHSHFRCTLRSHRSCTVGYSTRCASYRCGPC